ncbi:hypothetical protein ABZY14_40335 [Streptomyces sp. NPDC006617]|uniref:hypothetical protein n=1 Tax=Streptomyces sp. NPDC006617 TaxID=3155354 RepID=UPI0033ABB5DA
MPYEWPPLVPGDPDEIARRVAAVLEEAWERLASKQQEVLARFADNPRTPYTLATLATLEEFKQSIREFRQRVDQEAQHSYGGSSPTCTKPAAGRPPRPWA